MAQSVRIGTAGWTIPSAVSPDFPGEGGHLSRYSRRFDVAEINSSFHRPHRPATYARWAETVPPDFRFCAKVSRNITHERRLVDAMEPFEGFLAEVAPLGTRLGPLLIQLPPSLAFDLSVADAFFGMARGRFAGPVALEPRHARWFAEPADGLLRAHGISRVAADPARAESADAPGGSPSLVYMRLHGSPRVYFSSYEEPYLEALAGRLRRHAETGAEVWWIFDNTAHGAAAPNALAFLKMMSASA